MLAVEDLPAGREALIASMPFVESYDLSEIQHHAALLIEAKLLDGVARQTIGGGLQVRVTGLTWAGHDWLASVHNKDIWHRTMEVAKQKGIQLTLDMVKSIALRFAAAHLGLPGLPL
jgi:hypothetical protein